MSGAAPRFDVRMIDFANTSVYVKDGDPAPRGYDPADADDHDAGVLEIGQRGFHAGFDIDAVEQEILVPALILNIQQAGAVRGPEILADRAIGRLGHDLRVMTCLS